jgi:perosamine synthetase
MDPEDAARRITGRTKAILPVHLYGHPVNMDPIIMLACQHGLLVVEDAAESHGAVYKGRRTGSLGAAGCFSFYGNKIITTGEGGILLTDDETLAERARFLRDHGMDRQKRYWHPEIGYNYGMTNLQAALGLAQLENIEKFIQRKRWIAQTYNRLLAGLPGLSLPPEKEWATSVYWMYSIVLSEEFPLNRDDLMAALRRCGIDSRPFFYPLHTMPPYFSQERFPVAERLGRQGINLPSSVKLQEGDLQRVAEAIRRCR